MQEWELRHPAGLSSGECSLGRGGGGSPRRTSSGKCPSVWERLQGPEPGMWGRFLGPAFPGMATRGPRAPSAEPLQRGLDGRQGRERQGGRGGRGVWEGLLLGSPEPCLRAGCSWASEGPGHWTWVLFWLCFRGCQGQLRGDCSLLGCGAGVNSLPFKIFHWDEELNLHETD